MKKTIIAISVSMIMLSACGGGGGSSPNVNSTNTNGSSNTNSLHPKANDFSNSVSEYKKQAHVDKEKSRSGDGAVILLTDYGVNLNNKALVGNKNISTEMLKVGKVGDTDILETSLTKTEELGEYSHGTHMAQIIVNNANKAKVEVIGLKKPGVTNAISNSANYAEFKNADIANNSYGYDGQELDIYEGKTVDALKSYINKGGLFLISAGNDGNPEPNGSAQIPALDKSLEKGFITVAGSNKDGKMLYNYCGKAKDYCITSMAIHPTVNNFNENQNSGGTSSATAYTSAVAAKIKSRYDWMKNEELRDVLFTTATDAGEKGVDAVYGHGILNEEMALNGYGRFDNVKALNVDGKKSMYYFDNNISGTGGMIKNGQSTLVLNGNNTYTGGNTINQGELIINGQNKSAFNVNGNGKLTVGDDKTISTGKLVNYGTLNANTSSDLSVNGDFVSKGLVNKAIGSTIKVTGNVDIDNSKLNITGITKGYVTSAGKQEDLITGNKINGKFAQITAENSDLIDNKITLDEKAVYVVTKRKEVGSVVNTQSNYVGKNTATANAKALLDDYDAIVNSGNVLNDKQEAVASAILLSSNLTETLFGLNGETAKHAIENASINEVNQNNNFIENATSKENAMWFAYSHAKADLKMDGLKGESSDNSFGIGGVKSFANQALAFEVTNQNYKWSEKFGNTVKDLNTDGVGFDIAYIYSFENGYQTYGFTGYNWLTHKNAYDKVNGKQYYFGLGVSKLFNINENWMVTPNVNLQYINTNSNDMKITENVSVNNLKNEKVIANMSVKGDYKVNDKFNVFGKLGISQDLSNKNKYIANYAGSQYINESNDIGKTRISAGLGASYQALENLGLAVSVNHNQGNNWKQNRVDFNMSYKF